MLCNIGMSMCKHMRVNKLVRLLHTSSMHVQARPPLLATPNNLMELGFLTCLVEDVSNSQALRESQNESHVDFVMMVAIGITIVVCSPYATDLATLKQVILVLGQYNKKWGNMRVNHGAYYFEMLVLSRFRMNEESISKSLHENPKKDPGCLAEAGGHDTGGCQEHQYSNGHGYVWCDCHMSGLPLPAHVWHQADVGHRHPSLVSLVKDKLKIGCKMWHEALATHAMH